MYDDLFKSLDRQKKWDTEKLRTLDIRDLCAVSKSLLLSLSLFEDEITEDVYPRIGDFAFIAYMACPKEDSDSIRKYGAKFIKSSYDEDKEQDDYENQED